MRFIFRYVYLWDRKEFGVRRKGVLKDRGFIEKRMLKSNILTSIHGGHNCILL